MLAIAEQELLTASSLTKSDCHKVLANMMQPAIDYADLYFQATEVETWVLDDGIVKDTSYDISRGVGVRAVSGEKSALAYADNITLDALKRSAKSATGIAAGSKSAKHKIAAWQQRNFKALYGSSSPLLSLTAAKKVKLLQDIDKLARSIDPRIKHVTATLSGSYNIILVMATDGTYVPDIRPLVRLNVSVIAESNNKREQGFSGGGARLDYQMFFKDDAWQSYTKEAVRLALLNLDAKPMPAGNMDIVLGSGWPGVLLHEAIGHGLEGDFNRKKTSAFSSLMGKKVAASNCTVVDNGSLANLRGSLSVDDEGTKTRCTTLIENGILKSYMHDKLNAKLMNTVSTGNARRQSYAHLPMPRMTNTYMLPGKYKKDEVISSVKDGLYAVNFSGGQVDITSGKFVFVVNEAYLIKDGKITHPVKGATLIGDGPTALHKISMVADDLALDNGIGICGKDGQTVPVGVGMPTIRLNDVTVGGVGST